MFQSKTISLFLKHPMNKNCFYIFSVFISVLLLSCSENKDSQKPVERFQYIDLKLNVPDYMNDTLIRKIPQGIPVTILAAHMIQSDSILNNVLHNLNNEKDSTESTGSIRNNLSFTHNESEHILRVEFSHTDPQFTYNFLFKLYMESEQLDDEFLHQMMSENYELELKYQEMLMHRTNSNEENKIVKQINEARKKILKYIEQINLAFDDRLLICRQKLIHKGVDVKDVSIHSNSKRKLDVLNKLYTFLLEKKIFLTIYRAGFVMPVRILEKSRK